MGSANIMYFASRIAPIYPIYIRKMGDDGKPYIATDKYGHQRYDYGVPAGYGMTRPFMATGNPLGANLYNTNDLGVNQLNGTFIADISFTDWLKLNVTSNVNYNTAEISIYTNSFEGPGSGDNGRLQKGNTNTLRTNNTQTLTFMKSFGKHNVDALVGHEYYKQQVKYLYSAAKGEFSPYLQEIYAYANKYDGSSYTNNYNVEGFFGRAQYNYDGRYFASLSYRRDASSYFAKDHRWGDFWSVGGAWIISKEQWFNAPFVDELKLKASIGQQGNDNIGAFAYTQRREGHFLTDRLLRHPRRHRQHRYRACDLRCCYPYKGYRLEHHRQPLAQQYEDPEAARKQDPGQRWLPRGHGASAHPAYVVP